MHFIFKKNYILIGGSLLILGAAIYAAQWKWHFWHATQNSPSVMANVMEAEQNQELVPPDNNNMREVLAANLFGAEGVAKTASTEAVPQTEQPLELHGIVFIPNHPEQSVALVAQVGQLAKDYKKGDKVLPDVTVVEISPDVVFIENQGVREKLVLPKPDYSQTGNQQTSMNPLDNMQAQDAVEPASENIPPADNMQPPPENLPLPESNDPRPMPNGQPPNNEQPVEQPPTTNPVENPAENL